MDYLEITQWARGYLDALLEHKQVDKESLRGFIIKMKEAVEKANKKQGQGGQATSSPEPDDLPF